MHPSPVIFDEARHAPDLLPYIKERIDERRNLHGQYLLTGSQNLLLTERVTESLAGRAAMPRLLPPSQREMDGRSAAPLPWESTDKRAPGAHASGQELWKGLLRGAYPELDAPPRGDLTSFQGFVRALAARTGQLLNLTGVARDLASQ